MDVVTEMIDGDDAAGLLRLVDALCETTEWDEILRLAAACRAAVEHGRQLWSVAMHADYRLALEAPGPIAASVLESDAGRFTLGPLTEVIASTHDWESIADHIESPHVAASVAQERILRGEDLTGDERAHDHVHELPLSLIDGETGKDWLPIYRADSAEFGDPPPLHAPNVQRAHREAPVSSAPATSAWRNLFEVWTGDSNATVAVATVDDFDPCTAIESIADSFSVCEIGLGEALARTTWAAASGAAHGRRRGGATGRFEAWWCLSEIVGAPWPPDHASIEMLAACDWYWWAPSPRPSGWVFGLAVAPRQRDRANAVLALDAADSTDTERDGYAHD